MSAVFAVLGGLQHPGRPLAEPARLFSPIALLRPQVSSRATALSADGVTWSELGADAPRFHGSARRLLVGGQRTNTVRNPRAEGSPPTNWVVTPLAGLTTTFISSGVADGINFATYEVSGTPTATTGSLLAFDTSIMAAASEVWSGSAFIGLDPTFSNDVSGMQFALRLFAVSDPAGTSFTPTTAALSGQRVVTTRTMPASTTTVQPRIRYSGTLGVPVLFRIRVGWPLCERAAFASSPVLPPIGGPAASTRGADMLSASLSSLGIAVTGAGTILLSCLVPQSGHGYTLVQVDDGTESNRLGVVSLPSATQLRASRNTAGAGAGIDIGTQSTAAVFRLGMSLDGAGRMAVSLNGAAVLSVSGAPIVGLTTLRISNNSVGTGPAFLELAHLRVLRFAVSDAGLRSLTAGLPG